uniref:Uncharacterized protein n=1 Tax=Kalanchoe fedtschenkoi TaxID=63787 RepID=A0A7N0ZV18_KALFE
MMSAMVIRIVKVGSSRRRKRRRSGEVHFGFEVAVEDVAGVAVADGGDELIEVFMAEILAESSSGDLGEKLAALLIYHNDVDFGFGGHDVTQLDDVGVVHPAHDGDFSLDLRGQPSGDDPLLASSQE